MDQLAKLAQKAVSGEQELRYVHVQKGVVDRSPSMMGIRFGDRAVRERLEQETKKKMGAIVSRYLYEGDSDDEDGSEAKKKAILDMSVSELAYLLRTPVASDSSVHITKMPREVLLEIAKLLCGPEESKESMLDLVSLGLTCRVAYSTLKTLVQEPLSLSIGLGYRTYDEICEAEMRRAKSGIPTGLKRSLVGILILPDTFKHTDLRKDYHFCINRGDGKAIFLNKKVYGKDAWVSDEVFIGRYRLYGHFKRFHKFVFKGSSCRIASPDPISGPALMPSPVGKSLRAWYYEIMEEIKTDIKWWAYKDEWLGFWKEGFAKCGAVIDDEDLEMLDAFGEKHVWPVVSDAQRQIAERMIARCCELYKRDRN